MRVPWLRLSTTEGQMLVINCNHVGLIGEYYKEVTKMESDGKNHLRHEVVPDKSNVLIQGTFISIQGSPLLIQTLVSKALAEETAIDNNKDVAKIKLVPQKES